VVIQVRPESAREEQLEIYILLCCRISCIILHHVAGLPLNIPTRNALQNSLAAAGDGALSTHLQMPRRTETPQALCASDGGSSNLMILMWVKQMGWFTIVLPPL